MRILFTKRVNDCLLAIYYYTILDVSITIFISCIGAVIVEKIVKMLVIQAESASACRHAELEADRRVGLLGFMIKMKIIRFR